MSRLLIVTFSGVCAARLIPQLLDGLSSVVSSASSSRAKLFPTTDEISDFADAKLELLQMPQTYLVAEQARLLLVSGLIAAENAFNDFLVIIDTKDKALAKVKRAALVEKIRELHLAAATTVSAHAELQAFDDGKTVFSALKATCSDIIAKLTSVKDCGRLKVVLQRSMETLDGMGHLLASQLQGLSHNYLVQIATYLDADDRQLLVKLLWKYGKAIMLKWADVSLRIFQGTKKASGTASDRVMPGQRVMVYLSPRTRSAHSAIGVVVQLNGSLGIAAGVQAHWRQFQELLSVHNNLYREITQMRRSHGTLGSKMEAKALDTKLSEYRRTLFPCLREFQALNWLLGDSIQFS